MKTQAWFLLIMAALALQSCGKSDDGILASHSGHEAHEEIFRREREREIEETKIFGKKSLKEQCRYASSIGVKPPYKRVALTFDDGPTRDGTNHVLDVLQKYKIPATFFMQGALAKAGPGLVDKVGAGDGLLVANHSWNHPNFHSLDLRQQKSQVQRTFTLLKKHQDQKFFRYPYGNSTCASNDYARSLGYKIVGWHVDSCDWAFNRTGTVSAKDAKICGVRARNISNFARHVVESVMARRGGIVLLHDTRLNTAGQLEEIINELEREGYTFGSLDEPGFAPSLR